MSAILFGSISTLADTSELQRRAFNEAFAAHGLNWQWSRDDYREMLGSNGGAQRIADHAASCGDDVDAAEVHAAKSAIFQELLGTQQMTARPGVAETIKRAREGGHKVGLVTTTSRENVAALLDALRGEIDPGDFDIVVDKSAVEDPKPAPSAYLYALSELGVDAADAVAIEDNEGGLKAAVDAGIACVAFPNENTAGGDFGDATETVDSIDLDRLSELANA
ncbi:HAD family hydrolase [Mycobacterium sp. NPDC051804]|uniref:HAD family hydrolase n=1 Tax=Mycobacterium sp. NPDC051804 TaxID=3364295 RepID=UPI0037A534B0